ncbi:MAG TPA: peptidoglycan recognition family protein [Tepidisphaeraceae bacterium]|nr:peptidoglycan recognition family protein [Tepidisphaeraceae bacterium]
MTYRVALFACFALICGCVIAAVAADDAPAAANVEKPPIVTAKEWGSKPQPIPDSRKHTPKYITIHHAGVIVKSTTDPATFVKNMQGWGQRDKNWPDLPYHFLIAPDGRIFEGRDLTYEGETNTKYPLKDQVQVELMGDFTKQRMTPRQLESLVKLTAWLCAEYKIDPILMGGHNERAPRQTSCPGTDLFRYIEDGQLTKWVAAIIAGKPADVKERPALPEGPTIYVGDPEGDPRRETTKS